MIKIAKTTKALINSGKLSPLKILNYAGLGIGALLLVAVLMFLLFPDPFINSFMQKRITKVFTISYPADSLHVGKLHFNLWKNKLECQSIIMKSSEYNCRIGPTSISGISWMKILWNKDITLNDFRSSIINAQNITLTFRQTLNELYIDKLHVSIHDSEMMIDSIKFYSLLADEKFFAKSKYRQTRFRSDISSISITGLDCLKMFQGKIYTAKCINIHNIFTDILVSMDKPYDNHSSNPQMPIEFLASIKDTIKINSLRIFNGRLKYSERFEAEAKPGVVTFNNVNVTVSRIANHTGQSDTSFIIGDGLFMNSGKMKLLMEIPLSAKDFSLRYSGSLSSMDASKLNSFIEPGQQRRIKSGILKSAEFNISVIRGHSKGVLYLSYKDLSFVIINKETGSENGIIDRISSLFGKLFVIRGSNMPDKNGKMKLGSTKYSRNPNDYFFQFIWFALRNGIADVVGLPPI
jgi:hypothetical protein